MRVLAFVAAHWGLNEWCEGVFGGHLVIKLNFRAFWILSFHCICLLERELTWWWWHGDENKEGKKKLPYTLCLSIHSNQHCEGFRRRKKAIAQVSDVSYDQIRLLRWICKQFHGHDSTCTIHMAWFSVKESVPHIESVLIPYKYIKVTGNSILNQKIMSEWSTQFHGLY